MKTKNPIWKSLHSLSTGLTKFVIYAIFRRLRKRRIILSKKIFKKTLFWRKFKKTIFSEKNVKGMIFRRKSYRIIFGGFAGSKFVLAEIYIWLIWKQEGCWNVCDWTIGICILLFVCFQPIKIFCMFPVLSILRFLRTWIMYLHKIERAIKSRVVSPIELESRWT